MSKNRNKLLRLLTKPFTDAVTEEISKQLATQIKQPDNSKTFSWDYPVGWNYIQTNKKKRKPEGYVDYDVLRKFSVHYPIARAAIDYLKTKALKLDWKINRVDGEKVEDDPRAELAESFFKKPLGPRSNYREFIDALLEDYLVIGNIAVERLQTRGGQFLNQLKLVDAATIRAYVDESGRIPEPPEYAYAQVIRGQIVSKLTRNDLIFAARGNRTNTVYGLSPLESIIVQAESALKGSLYSLGWFSDGNMPEGFLEMPEDWTPEQIKEYERYFNAMLSGNYQEQRKIKPIPSGAKFSPIKKPEDIGYERFEQWILQLTCSVFGVPPQDIGFTYEVNRSTGQTQQELGEERGLVPIAQFLQDIFTSIVQDDLGFKDLEFSFSDIDPVDKLEEARIDEIRVRSGIESIDEIRRRSGLDPIGIENYIPNNVILASRLLDDPQENEDDQAEEEPEKEDDEIDKLQKQDLRLWRKKARNSLKKGEKQQDFVSASLDQWMIDEISKQLQKSNSKDDVDSVFEPYLNNTMQTLNELQRVTEKLYAATDQEG